MSYYLQDKSIKKQLLIFSLTINPLLSGEKSLTIETLKLCQDASWDIF